MTEALRTRTIIAVFAIGLGAPVLSGCVRTSDGTLLFTERTAPARITGMADPARYSSTIRERRNREAAAASFPHPPRGKTVRWRPREDRVRAPNVAGVRVGVASPFKPARASDDGLNCRNETTATGRVKVVCD